MSSTSSKDYNPANEDDSSSSADTVRRRTSSPRSIQDRIQRMEIESAPPENGEGTASTKKRKAKGSRKEKERRKYLRNAGREYVSVSGKVVDARKRIPPHTCKKHKCHEKISDEVGESIFCEYWEQESYDARVKYVASRVDVVPVKRKRPRLHEDDFKAHPKSKNYHYWLEVHGVRVQVCKETFLRTLGETDMFLRRAVSNKSESVSGVTHQDLRGKHPPIHKLPDAAEEAVRNHILSYPAYESHYSRKRTDAKFLPSSLNVTKMFTEYLKNPQNPKVSYTTYLNIFQTTGRKFKQPKTDTCSKCDEWDISSKVLSGPQLEEVLTLREEHLDRAEAAYERKREEKLKAQSDPSRRVLIFDLEQCLETPYLQSGSMFYLRQLYTFNLTVYDTTTKLTTCYMWHEGEGGRGGNQIASCLFRHICDEVPAGVKHISLFSDSCSGQNRNSHISAMLFAALQLHETLETIDHIFLEVGHTRMECDSKHSLIERSKLTVDKINVPEDWFQHVSSLNKITAEYPNGMFKVTKMNGFFFDFAKLLKGPLVLRTKTTAGKKFSWFNTQLFSYRGREPGLIYTKKSLRDEEYEVLSFNRKGKPQKEALNLMMAVDPCYTGPVPISEQKKADLLKCLRFLEEKYHPFYQQLRSEFCERDVDPDIPYDEEAAEDDVTVPAAA